MATRPTRSMNNQSSVSSTNFSELLVSMKVSHLRYRYGSHLIPKCYLVSGTCTVRSCCPVFGRWGAAEASLKHVSPENEDDREDEE